MDSKQIARQIVEKEFFRSKRRKKNADYSSDEEEGNNHWKRSLITPTQVKVKENKVHAFDSKYRDRAQERREGTLREEDDEELFGFKDDVEEESLSVPDNEKATSDGSEANRFETREQAQEFLRSSPPSSTTLGRSIVRFWCSRWQNLDPKSALKHSSSVYTMTTATHPPVWLIPSEKTYPSTVHKESGPFLTDDLLQRIKRACTRIKTASVTAAPNETISKGDAKSDDDDDDIFNDVGDYAEEDNAENKSESNTRRGEKVALFEHEEVEVAPVVIIQPQRRRLEGYSSAYTEVDYPNDDSSGDEGMKPRKKKRKKQRSGSDSV